MAAIKPSIPKGTRDFSPQEVQKRNFIFSTIREVFELYGFQPIETPVMENLETLTGKYGEEGDKLLFRVLNAGDYLKDVPERELIEKDHNRITSKIAGKGLRYDLTIPFARYVVMNQSAITFPFKRYQIQPVWRGDRPQKGRYREFYQCDADVIGSDSLLYEAEFILIYLEAFKRLGLSKIAIKLNNRKILEGITEVVGIKDKFMPVTIAIDKLDKIGAGGVKQEMLSRGIAGAEAERVLGMTALSGSLSEKISKLKQQLKNSATGTLGIHQMEQIYNYLELMGHQPGNVNLDLSLARGLNYYTGTIIEVKCTDENVSIGSIGGGGRYDDLTGMFGLQGISGVGISFGADRIYDVMEQLNLFPESAANNTKILIIPFDETAEKQGLQYLKTIREAGIKSEIYPVGAKLKKQMGYANAKNIPFIALIGSEELKQNKVTLKDMDAGSQELLSLEGLIDKLKG